MKEDNKPTMPSLASLVLLFVALFSAFSSIMYTLSGGEEWFSRLFLAVVSIGFWAILDAIKCNK